MGSELLERARDLRSTIDAAGAAAAASGETTLPQEAVDACFEAGLYGTLSPRAVGGAELLPIDECLDVFAEVAYADGSVGWSLMAGATGACFFGAYCEDSFTDEMFAGGVVPVVAGQFAPNGTAVPHAGGYRLTGKYSFGSGIAHADWVGGGAFTAPPEGEQAEFRLMIMPRSEVEVLGNWEVLGLRATSSYDYRIDTDVPAHASFDFFSPTRYRGGPTYDLGVIILTEIGHMGWTIGVVRRAIDEAVAIARGRARMAAPSVIADDPRFRYEFAMAVSRFEAAEAWCRQAFRRAEQAADAGSGRGPKLGTHVKQSATLLTQEGLAVVRSLYQWCGTEALRDGPLQRCFRDMHAGSQHVLVGDRNPHEYADLLLADPPPD